jgi:cell division protein FtsQ
VRRIQQVVPRTGRTLPGMQPEFDDPDDDERRFDSRIGPRMGRRRFGDDRDAKPRVRWWRPVSKTGRIFLAVGAVAVLCAFTAGGLALKHFLERDGRFRIASTENIEASGLTELSRADLLPVFGEDVGRNIFFVPLNARRKQLEQIPWIAQATVVRLLPDQIRVTVVERKPVAFTRHGQQIGLVDANGVLLGMSATSMAEHHYSFPVVTGIDPGDSADARKSRMGMYLRMMAELDADGKHNSEQISEIDLTDPEDARVLMPEEGKDILVHFGEDHFLERFEQYQAHIAEWRQQYPHLASVDLRWKGQEILQMSSGKETAQADSGANAAKSAPTPLVSSSAASSDAPKQSPGKPAKKIKPAPAKKHAVAKRMTLKTARSNTSGRNPALKTTHMASSGEESGQ